MTETPAPVREVVGVFADRDQFDQAVKALLDSGFARSDLSVLASHASLDAAGSSAQPLSDTLVALLGEAKYEWPLVASGAVVLAGGPVGATLGAVIGAATAGVVAKDVLDEVTATAHTDEFAHALEAGSVILWVMVTTPEREAEATSLLTRHCADNVHVHQR